MKARKKGSVILIAVFAIALLSTLVVGIIQMNIEEIQLMQNHVNAAQSTAVAEAGLNEAFAELRQDSSWTTGFAGKGFAGGSYTVTVAGALPNLALQATGTSAMGYVSRVDADITVGTDSPYIIRVDNMRINE